MESKILKVDQIQFPFLEEFIQESSKEGLSFLKRFKAQYISGDNRFEAEGEGFFFYLQGDQLVAVCGVNIDPYLDDPEVCRLRHLYVHPQFRKNGIGKKLTMHCIEFAKTNFQLMTLRTFDENASDFYKAVGFLQEEMIYSASHYYFLRSKKYLPKSYIDKINEGEYVLQEG